MSIQELQNQIRSLQTEIHNLKMNENRPDRMNSPMLSVAATTPDAKDLVHDIPVWAKVALAAGIPMLGGIAAIPGIPPLVAVIAGTLAIGLTGVATWYGMKVGSPKS